MFGVRVEARVLGEGEGEGLTRRAPGVRVVSEGHDALGLVLLPLEEELLDALDVEGRVVGQLDQVGEVVALEVDAPGWGKG